VKLPRCGQETQSDFIETISVRAEPEDLLPFPYIQPAALG